MRCIEAKWYILQQKCLNKWIVNATGTCWDNVQPHTQTVLGGLTTYTPVTIFLQCICAKNYENRLRVDKVISMKKGCGSLAHTACITNMIIHTGFQQLLGEGVNSLLKWITENEICEAISIWCVLNNICTMTFNNYNILHLSTYGQCVLIWLNNCDHILSQEPTACSVLMYPSSCSRLRI